MTRCCSPISTVRLMVRPVPWRIFLVVEPGHGCQARSSSRLLTSAACVRVTSTSTYTQEQIYLASARTFGGRKSERLSRICWRVQGASISPAPGPTGRPSHIHMMSSTAQQVKKAKVYGSMVATTVPMPERLS